MGAADGRARAFSRADRRVRVAAGIPPVSARRHLAEFFHEVLRIESAAEKNGARFGQNASSSEHSRRQDKAFRAIARSGGTLLLRSQCNDAYWHGVFGGLYAPHLRTALWNPWFRRRRLPIGSSHRAQQYVDVAQFDFDADGREEIYFTSDRYAALLTPEDGATICAIDCRATNAALDQFSRRASGGLPRGTEEISAARSRSRNPSTNRRA